MNRELNDGSYLAEQRAAGIWPDNTTKETRYEGFARELVGLADDGHFDDRDSIRMLDVGASTGKAPYGLSAVIEQVIGVDVETVGYDISAGALQQYRDPDTGEHAYLDHQVQGDARQLPFPDGAFDLVTSKTLLSRIHGADQSAALREIDRVLADDGVAAVEVDPTGEDRVYTGDEHVMPAADLAALREASGEFEAYPLEPEQGTPPSRTR